MKPTLLIFLILISGFLSAQTLRKSSISTEGGSVENPNMYLAYALGELGVRENLSGNIYLSEGFIGPDLYKIMDVEDFETLTGVKLFPNPFNEYLRITLPEEGNYEVEIYDLTGQMVHSSHFTGTKLDLPLQQLKPGTYIVGIADRTHKKFAALKAMKR